MASVPLDRLLSRVESIISRAEQGQEIDWKKEQQLSDLDTVAASIHFAAEAIERTNEADAAWEKQQLDADLDLLQ